MLKEISLILPAAPWFREKMNGTKASKQLAVIFAILANTALCLQKQSLNLGALQLNMCLAE